MSTPTCPERPNTGAGLLAKRKELLAVRKQLDQGVTRGEVEMHLGQPVQTTTQPDGSVISAYTYQVGNDPSAGRAMGHAAMDVLTLGLWEIVGTPVEGFQGETYRATVTYAPDGTVRSVSTQKAGS